MNNRLRGASRRTMNRFSPIRPVTELHRRILDLEAEVQETRRLNRRVAELLDIVQELLVPLAERDEAKVREYLDRYSSSL
jgi:hypothetical protein